MGPIRHSIQPLLYVSYSDECPMKKYFQYDKGCSTLSDIELILKHDFSTGKKLLHLFTSMLQGKSTKLSAVGVMLLCATASKVFKHLNHTNYMQQ